MKKILSFIALAITIGMTSCSDDECDHGIEPTIDGSIVGSWYEEAENEEMRFGESGTFYDRYANYLRCAEVEGRWEYDKKNSKLTYNYPFLGQTQFADWTVKNLKELSFTIYSEMVGEHNLEKIVESYNLEIGKTATIQFSNVYPDYTVISYTSNNERIASVTSDGIIKAEGEKGITYIKVETTKSNVWVKVTVGDNCSDKWHDYVGLLGLDYSGMRKQLSRLGDPYSGDDGYSFGFKHLLHEVADITKVFMCPECGIVTEIQLLVKESVPEAEILSYMNSHYYKFGETDKYVFFSSVEDREASKAIVAYNKSEKCVLFNETQHFLHYPHVKDLWTDFTPLFGSDKDQVKTKMNEYGYSFLLSDYNYSKDGSDYYDIPDNSYAQMVGFVFNPDKKLSEFWVYMDRNNNANDVYNYLCAKYTEQESESTDYSLVFYNEDKSLKVTLDLENAAVVYTKLTMKQHEANPDILGNYYEGIGLSRAQIIDKYGAPYMDEDNIMTYVVGSAYVNLAFFNIKAETSKCNLAMLTINENVETSTIIDYLNSKYTVFANGTASDGSQYAWTDGPSVAESTLGVIYKPVDRVVVYQPLGSSSSAKSLTRAIGGFTTDLNLMKQAHSQTSSFLNSIYRLKEGIMTFKSKHFENIISNYNK